MIVRTWQFVAMMALAMTMANPYAHLLEMVPRLNWEPRLWLETTVTGDIFLMFRTWGRDLERVCIGILLLGVYLTRHRSRPTFYLTLTTAIIVVVAFLTWWFQMRPAIAAFSQYTPENYGADFEYWRNRWEYGHLVRAPLFIISLATLLLSIMFDKQEDRRLDET